MGLLDRFAKRRPRDTVMTQMIGGYTPSFSPFGSDIYNSDIARPAIHTIAMHAAKLKPRHIRRGADGIKDVDAKLNDILQTRPNPQMSTYDFIYKVITHLLIKSNAYVLVDESGFYPIDATSAEMLQGGTDYFVRFRLLNGKELTVPYEELIHLRRHFSHFEMTGSSSDAALLPTLELMNTANQGITNAVKQGAFLRGLLKYQILMNDKDLKSSRERFVSDYMRMDNAGGVAALDGKADYIPLNQEAKPVNAPQMDFIRSNIYRYFGVSENIIQNTYTEDQWNAFYEGAIEPLAVQLSLEFTAKTFTPRERAAGNTVIFEANRLQYASARTKIALARELMPMGLFTVNEMREVFNLAPVKDGDKRMQTLNVVDAAKANSYQLGTNDTVPKESEGGDTDESGEA